MYAISTLSFIFNSFSGISSTLDFLFTFISTASALFDNLCKVSIFDPSLLIIDLTTLIIMSETNLFGVTNENLSLDGKEKFY